ncbi:Kinesin-like protein at 10A [Carabus blaptoides fortunei]
MDEESYNIKKGCSVNIKRTDGRVHSAIVSGVNWSTRSVTVEWFEKGETKGKEVEIDAIIALNPEVLICRNQDKKPPALTQEPSNIITAQNNLTRNASRQSIPVSNKGSYRATRNNQSRLTNGLNDQDRRENLPPSSSTSLIGRSNSQLNHQNTTVAATLAVPLITGGGSTRGTRRSNVVKEVEKLKKNREERRQRQAEEKAEKEAFLQQAPGNPYWEFLNMVQDYQRTIEFKPLTENDPVEDHQITVCVRKRPLNKKEGSRKEVDVIAVPTKDTVIVHEPKNKVDLTKYLENQFFRFDYAFNESCTNEIVYKYTAQPLVKTIFEGGMATCFAYGQTGSGKTHTMGGDFNGKTQDCQKGIYALVAKDVFQYLKSSKYRSLNFIVSASFFEIYSGKVFDLLSNKAKLRILEDGKQQVQVVGLTEKVVQTCDEVLKLIQHGNAARTSGQTSANTNSSRSHAIFQIVLRSPGMTKVHGKFSLIDLAGNERGADTSSANRQTRMEGAEINKSLLALKECIRALGKKGGHLPFRASKLTQVLRDSFIGEKSRTCMIAMISPGVASCEHSLNTLRYADRVKELAVNDPEMKYESHDNEGDENMPDDSDLLQLRSLNEKDMPDDLLNFHQAVSDLQAFEEEMIDNHKTVNEFLALALHHASQLYSTANNVEYDQDAYCQQWEDLLTEGLNVFGNARNIVREYRMKLFAEEQLSRQMKP